MALQSKTTGISTHSKGACAQSVSVQQVRRDDYQWTTTIELASCEDCSADLVTIFWDTFEIRKKPS